VGVLVIPSEYVEKIGGMFVRGERKKCRLCHKVLKSDRKISGCGSDIHVLCILEQIIDDSVSTCL
jgi:hypothetical protein